MATYYFTLEEQLDINGEGLGMLPCMFQDRQRRTVMVEPYRDYHFDGLSEMYDAFEPKAVAHGLPPENKAMRRKWIETTVEAGTNLVAVTGGRIVGHTILAPIPPGDRAEFGIFIHQEYQGWRIGTNLTCVAICCALKARFKSLWLIVEPANVRAMAMYRSVGFEFCDRMDREACMELDLDRLRC